MKNNYEKCLQESVMAIDTLVRTQDFKKAIAVEERARGYFELCTQEEQERIGPELVKRLRARSVYVSPTIFNPLRLK